MPASLNPVNNRFLEAAVAKAGSVPLDVFVIAALFALFVFLGFMLGKRYSVAFVFALPIAGFLHKFFFDNRLFSSITTSGNATQQALMNLGVFLVFFVVASFFLAQYIEADFSRTRIKKLLHASVLGVFSALLSVGSVLYVLSVDALYAFSAHTAALFTPAIFFWLTPLSLIGTYFLIRRS